MNTSATLAWSRKTSRWGWPVATGLLLLLAWGWWKGRNAAFRIHDNLVIKVAGVTVGTNHVTCGRLSLLRFPLPGQIREVVRNASSPGPRIDPVAVASVASPPP